MIIAIYIDTLPLKKIKNFFRDLLSLNKYTFLFFTPHSILKLLYYFTFKLHIFPFLLLDKIFFKYS